MPIEQWAFWGTLATAIFSLVAHAIQIRAGKREATAKARKVEQEITDSILENAKEEIDKYKRSLIEQDERINGLEGRIDEFEEAMKIKDSYIAVLEQEKAALIAQLESLKIFIRSVLKSLREQQIPYPEPPPGLLDTQPLNKSKK